MLYFQIIPLILFLAPRVLIWIWAIFSSFYQCRPNVSIVNKLILGNIMLIIARPIVFIK